MKCVTCGVEYEFRTRTPVPYGVLDNGTRFSRSAKSCSRRCFEVHTARVEAAYQVAIKNSQAAARLEFIKTLQKAVNDGPHSRCGNCGAAMVVVPKSILGEVAASPKARVTTIPGFCSNGCRKMHHSVKRIRPFVPERFCNGNDNAPDLIYQKRLEIDLEGLEPNMPD